MNFAVADNLLCYIILYKFEFVYDLLYYHFFMNMLFRFDRKVVIMSRRVVSFDRVL